MAEKLTGLALARAALTSRKTAVMLALGFASGLPFVLLIGTLNAWLGELKVSLATIGVLSWIGLAYAFKFLWSPVVDRTRPPLIARFGRRRSWLVLCQVVLGLLLWGLAATDPIAAIGSFAVLAVTAAFFSATQDVVIDAWRIEIADERATVEILSAIYQLGNRIAALAGGALALVLAARLGWPAIYTGFGVVMLALAAVTMLAPEAPDPEADARAPLEGHAVPDRRRRAIALGVVAVCWGWAILMLARFMVSALTPAAPGATAPSAGDFTKFWGPWIVVATVVVPALVSAWANGFASAVRGDPSIGAAGRAADHCYRALILPLSEIVSRLRWGAAVVVALILAYRICDSIWAPFAFPFYLDFLGYTNDEVAFASKLFGVLMTIVGVALGGFLFATLGRMPTLLAGAVAAAASNLLYADLALGGAGIDVFAGLFGLDRLGALSGADARMVRLMIAISGENIAGGLAGAAFVAYISSIVSKHYSAVQYALLSSLTFLVGALGRAAMGEAIEQVGYASVFRFTAALGLVAIGLVLLEWWRGAPREPAERSVPAV
ncbi:AmpG family muropeptide MFS transporter [Sphingomonas lenta]|uniref:MFS transporter n=1 Tax=Sphingomonas lenta TaxID=1141887 RepID=A0A2A2SH46_9SPHN|nr:MFS transporter [Sphingomonas lenta]PAX08532.1 hypothetical protein CKY28_03900 [Sphingomonas lenta]